MINDDAIVAFLGLAVTNARDVEYTDLVSVGRDLLHKHPQLREELDTILGSTGDRNANGRMLNVVLPNLVERLGRAAAKLRADKLATSVHSQR